MFDPDLVEIHPVVFALERPTYRLTDRRVTGSRSGCGKVLPDKSGNTKKKNNVKLREKIKNGVECNSKSLWS